MRIGTLEDRGAHFYRCDFQVHTPRDNQWSGDSPTDDAARAEVARRLVAHCRSTDLNAIAITDHHDFTFLPYVRRAAEDETHDDGTEIEPEERLVVFPGLELTLGQPTFQSILILDADFPEDRLSGVLEALSIEQTDARQGRLGPVTSVDHIKSPLDLYQELDKRAWLKGRFTLLPNVTDGGHRTMLRSGMKAAYREMPCVGGYVDGDVASLGAGNTRILAGEDPNYGNKRLAVFQTSDSRADTFANLGKHSTFVKWTSPTAEALRQACLAQESRISQVEPQLPNVAISRIDVSASRFMGPLSIAFNQQYNAIIGGRGTGKSTILGYLRWALGDEPIDAADEEAGTPGARQRRLISSTLASFDAQVDVAFTINGIPHVVRRHASAGTVRLKVGSEEFRDVRDEDVRSLLPIHAYGQKQLSSVAIRIEELTRFITAPIQPQLDEIDARIADRSGRLRENYATLQRVRTLDRALSRLALEMRSLEDQAESVRSSLTGLSNDDRATLAAKPAFDAAQDAERAIQRSTDSAAEVLAHAIASLVDLAAAAQPGSTDHSELDPLITELHTLTSFAIQDVVNRLQQAGDGLHAIQHSGTGIAALRSQLQNLQAEFQASYTAVVERSTAHETQVAELAELERRLSNAKTEYERQQAERSSLGHPEEQHRDLRQELIALARERSEIVAVQCGILDDLSGGLIHAELEASVVLAAPAERFRSAIAGSGVRATKIDALFDALQDEDDPLGTWSQVVDELEALVAAGPGNDIKSSATPVLSRLGFPVADQARALTRLTADGWLDLALTPAMDRPAFHYRVREDDYIAFADASAGQQATALLRVLLAQTGPPLLIDQPEDDLDSQVVLDIARRLWLAKGRRQLIFSSHNANLVVNGDAELVIVCENRQAGDQSGGVVAHQGAIDLEEVRSAITRVMEGGADAFKLRKEKYGF